jgi:hypothetical protein
MNEIGNAINQVDRNKIALILSILPGAGHLYKRHIGSGLAILIGGNSLIIFCAVWLSLATLGLSLVVVPILWIGGIAWSAFLLPDLHPGRTATPAPKMTETGQIKEPK